MHIKYNRNMVYGTISDAVRYTDMLEKQGRLPLYYDIVKLYFGRKTVDRVYIHRQYTTTRVVEYYGEKYIRYRYVPNQQICRRWIARDEPRPLRHIKVLVESQHVRDIQ